jgi:hypothetical protein
VNIAELRKNFLSRIRQRIFVGKHIKLQALLFCVIACCATTFFYGLIMYTDAPYKPCAGGYYCGKAGERYSYEMYKEWKRWEGILFVCWPFGIIASYGLRDLRKPPS